MKPSTDITACIITVATPGWTGSRPRTHRSVAAPVPQARSRRGGGRRSGPISGGGVSSGERVAFGSGAARASLDHVRNEQRLPTRTPESRAFAQRVQRVMALTSRLNALRLEEADARTALLEEIFGGPVPGSLSILPPFYCDYGLGTSFGERVFINQGCFLLDFGGISFGARVLIGPRVTLTTAGHPVEPDERYAYITHAPIVIEDDVWIGAGATIAPGVRIGHGSVVGAGAVVAKDVPPLSVVTATSVVERRRLGSAASTDTPRA
jgi:acetyltransferase-like isoleucine patch superfamily enzyme